jgi:hypothetical protein
MLLILIHVAEEMADAETAVSGRSDCNPLDIFRSTVANWEVDNLLTARDSLVLVERFRFLDVLDLDVCLDSLDMIHSTMHYHEYTLLISSVRLQFGMTDSSFELLLQLGSLESLEIRVSTDEFLCA